MKRLFTSIMVAILVLLSAQVIAQYSNASLNGPWYGASLEPDIYMIFDGNGNITELGAFGMVNSAAHVGTYTVTSSGYFTGSIVSDGSVMTITGQFVSTDSIVNINVGKLLPNASLSKIQDPGSLEGKWKGTYDNIPNVTNAVFNVDSSGKLIYDEDSVLGHLFQHNGKLVGFVASGDGSECWDEAQFVGTYNTNEINGTVTSGCNNIESSNFTFTRDVTITVSVSAGGLSGALEAQDKTSITDLKLSGIIDARDFKTMRDELPNLATVDLIDVTIAEYTGLGGTYGTESYSYPANSIPRNAFYKQGGNLTFTKIWFPESLTQISRAAFYGCKSLLWLEIPSLVTDIGQGAFNNCTNLISVLFRSPSSLVSIGYYAFGQCVQLNQVIDITPQITSIGDYAFLGSSVSITVSESNPNYSSFNGVLYNKNKTLLIYVPSTMAEPMVIPETVESIAIDAFYNCSGLTGVTIPNSVKKLGDWAFENCSGLTTITIPASVDSIGKEAFLNCTGLSSVYAEDMVPIDLSASDSVFKNVDVENCVLWVPEGTKTAYQNAIQWKDFKNIEEYVLTDVNEINNQDDLVVYPNPATDIIHIKGRENSLIRIYNSFGILISSFRSEGTLTSADISSLPSGAYLIQQQNESGIKTIKSIKY